MYDICKMAVVTHIAYHSSWIVLANKPAVLYKYFKLCGGPKIMSGKVLSGIAKE